MNIDKYREVISKIDTDKSMDKRIKDKVLDFEENAEKLQQIKKHNPNDLSNVKTYPHSFQKMAFMRSSLPSVAFIIFMIVILFGVKANLSKESATSNPETNSINAASGKASGNSTDKMSSSLSREVNNEAVNENETDNNEISSKNAKVSEGKTDKISGNEDEHTPSINDFYFAHFDVITEGDIKAAIPNLIIRFHGTHNKIDPNDLTDIILTKDGETVDNKITLTDKVDQFEWSNEDITDFYFKFDDDNRVPGNYTLTGKYKGEPFSVYNKSVESPISDVPADPSSLYCVSFAYLPENKEHPMTINEVVFSFKNSQNAFYQSDLTDLKLTLDGKEIPYSFEKKVYRYYEYSGEKYNTSFNLILTKELTESGTYEISGKYLGEAFNSMDISIP